MYNQYNLIPVPDFHTLAIDTRTTNTFVRDDR